MNKLVLPSIALAAILATGMLAFAPVQEASAVHTTLLANIEDQDRTVFFTIDAGGDAEANLTMITLGAADSFSAEISVTSSGTGACVLEDASATALVTGTVDDTVQNLVAIAGTFTGFALGEDIVLDAVPADTTCTVFMHIIEWE